MDGTPKLACPWDRTEESLGNVVELQHVNLQVPDQLKATGGLQARRRCCWR